MPSSRKSDLELVKQVLNSRTHREVWTVSFKVIPEGREEEAKERACDLVGSICYFADKGTLSAFIKPGSSDVIVTLKVEYHPPK